MRRTSISDCFNVCGVGEIGGGATMGADDVSYRINL